MRAVRAFTFFIARRVQHFLPSSTRVELYLPTLLGALGRLSFVAFLHIKANITTHCLGNRTQGPTLVYIVVLEGYAV